MSDNPEPTDDDVLDIIKDAIADHPNLSIMTPGEVNAFMTEGAKIIAQHDEQAQAEGRRFLSEENDRELIETWWSDAGSMKSINDAAAFGERLLSDYRHDYGTICHALAAGAYAMLSAMNNDDMHGGITGFQASAIAWMLYKHVLHLDDAPRRIIDYSDLLYPQMDHKLRTITPEIHAWLIEKAIENLRERTANPAVVARWQMIADGKLPAFMKVERS